ncbi:MAG: efflux RND transporter periplasmic adaptor subunit [Minisyncoccia bacterium]
MQQALRNKIIAYWKYAVIGIVVIVIGYIFLAGRWNNSGATLTISAGDFKEQVSVSGTIKAAQDVALGFAASGRISGMYAQVGQHVVAGTILAENENGDLVAAVAQKQAALAVAEANLAALHTGSRPEKVSVAMTAVMNARSSLVSAMQNAYTISDDAVHNKLDVLFTNPRTTPKLSFAVANASLKASVEQDRAAIEAAFVGWASLVATLRNDTAGDPSHLPPTQEYLAQVTTLLANANAVVNQGLPDQATSVATLTSYGTTLATARANVNAAATTFVAALATLGAAQGALTLEQAGPTSDAIAAQQAVVAVAKADVQNALAQLAKTRVSAPFDGIVTRMDAKVGEIVSPTGSQIAMQSDGIFQIETYVPEVAIAGVVVGNPATTTLDAYGSVTVFPSTVIAVDPAETIKDGVPTYKTTLAFLERDTRIRSGMTANVVIQTGMLHNAIVIPAGAVGTKNGESHVSVMSHGAVVNRSITTGVSPALGQIQILSGLSAGDVILLAPAP